MPPPQPPLQPNRPADTLVASSEKRLKGLSLITKSQIKLWKAMLTSLFFAGFVAAIASSVSFRIGQKSDAASHPSTNLLKGAIITSPVFCEGGECWDNLSSGGSLMFRQFGIPEAVIEFPGTLPYTLTRLDMDIDPDLNDRTMLPKDIRVERSENCVNYQPLLSLTKDQTSSSQSFDFPSGAEARCLKLVFDSNWGHGRWTTVQGIRMMGD